MEVTQNCWEMVDDLKTPAKSVTGRTRNLVSHLVLHKKPTLLTLFRKILTSSFLQMVWEGDEAASLCHSHILQQRLFAAISKNRIFSTDTPAGLEILLSGECSSGSVRLPRWVLEGKEELPHVAGMKSSLCTGPPFHMRSNPPTLFSLPVSLCGNQYSVWQEINANTKSIGLLEHNPCFHSWPFLGKVTTSQWQNDLKAVYLRSISMTFNVSSNSRNFIS